MDDHLKLSDVPTTCAAPKLGVVAPSFRYHDTVSFAAVSSSVELATSRSMWPSLSMSTACVQIDRCRAVEQTGVEGAARL